MSLVVAIGSWLLYLWGVSLVFVAVLLCLDAAGRRAFGRGLSPNPPAESFWTSLVAWAELPLTVVFLVLCALVWTPYHWLYPERHLTTVDVEGSAEERAALNQRRAALSRKPLWRRLAERLVEAVHRQQAGTADGSRD